MKLSLSDPKTMSTTRLVETSEEDERLRRLNRMQKLADYVSYASIVIALCVCATLWIKYQSIKHDANNEKRLWEQSIDRLASQNADVYGVTYDKFAAAYGRNVLTRADFEKKKDAFYEQSRNIIAYRRDGEHGDVDYGHNDMSDWTDEQFAKMLMPLSSKGKLRETATFIKDIPEDLAAPIGDSASAYPDFFDWRDKNVITPVKAQGGCGSCWAFASTATVEAAFAIAHGEKRNLSEQTLLDCDLDDNACNGGDEDKAFRYIHRNGLAYAEDLPYVAHRQDSCSVTTQWNTTKIKAAYFIHPDEESIINWLINFGPVNIGMSVIQPMRSYKGGVFRPSDDACKNEVIGLHALLITGYGTSEKGEKYWIIKNSWGNTWGVESGYIYFARGVNACGVEDEPIGILA